MLGYSISVRSVPGGKQKGAGVQENAVGRTGVGAVGESGYRVAGNDDGTG